MSHYIEQALKYRPESSSPWLDVYHRLGRNSCHAKLLPTRKTENWKYTSLHLLDQNSYSSEIVPFKIDTAMRDHFPLKSDVHTLVFVNGQYSDALSDYSFPAGVDVVRFDKADAALVGQINTRLGTLARREDNVFTALNESALSDGVYIRVKENIAVDKPIQVVYLTTPQQNSYTVYQRLLLVMEKGSRATLLESFTSDDLAQNSFTNGITELVLNHSANLQHYRLHTEQEGALFIGGVYANLNSNSTLNSFQLATGGVTKRVDVTVNCEGAGAHCRLNGAYLLRADQHVDFHTNIEHKVPHCTSTENFRGIIGDQGRAVFNGRIHIHPNAQKTRAQLSNKNLLTSDKAEVNTKPELEIYADDVQCAHGATVAQLDETALHYLKTRGVNHNDATLMLSFGFVNELLNAIPDPAIADYLRPLLTDFLSFS